MILIFWLCASLSIQLNYTTLQFFKNFGHRCDPLPPYRAQNDDNEDVREAAVRELVRGWKEDPDVKLFRQIYRRKNHSQSDRHSQ